MEFAKKNLLADLRKAPVSHGVAQEANENDCPSCRKESNKSFMLATVPVAPEKILAERNGAHPFQVAPQAKPVVVSEAPEDPSQISPFSLMASLSGDQKVVGSDSFRSLPYDPLTNYLSPRPEFLRYNPNRRREILRRVERERRNGEEGSESDSGLFTDPEKLSSKEYSRESSASSQTTLKEREIQEREEDGSDAEDCGVEEEEMEEKPRCSGMLWKLVLLLGVLLPPFCYMSSMSPARMPLLQENGVFQEKHLGIHDEFVMGLSNMCSNVCNGDITYGDEGISNRVLDSVDLIGSKGSNKTGLGISETHTGDGEIIAGLTTSEDPTRRMGLKGKELLEGMKLESEGVEEHLEESKILRADDFAFEGHFREYSSFLEFPELEQFRRRDEVSGQNEILAAELMESEDNSDVMHGVPQDLHCQSDSLDSLAIQDLYKMMFGDEKQGTDTTELTESSRLPHVWFDSNILLDNPSTEEFEIPTILDSESAQEQVTMPIHKDEHLLLHILLSLSVLLLGMLGGFYKYFRRSYEESSASSAPLSVIPFETTPEEKTNLVNSNREDMESKGCFLTFDSLSLNHFSDGHKKSYGTQPPKVELLGEFSIVETTVSPTCSVEKLRKKEREELQLSESQRRISTRKSLSSSGNQVHLSPESFVAADSTPNGNSTTEQKLLRKQDVRGMREAVKAVATPLRRSSRLQHRVATP